MLKLFGIKDIKFDWMWNNPCILKNEEHVIIFCWLFAIELVWEDKNVR